MYLIIVSLIYTLLIQTQQSCSLLDGIAMIVDEEKLL
jgi:hypothetical protein